MKRIQLFEFEDLPWFPGWLRSYVTRLIVVMHRFLQTPAHLARMISPILKSSPHCSIIDLCSGSGGPMPEVFKILKDEHGFRKITLTLSDLYPDQDSANKINIQTSGITYLTTPINATKVPDSLLGLRTLVGSFHHMPPTTAKKILTDAKDSNQPICIYEISDNKLPTMLWWMSIPMIFLMAFFITPFARPLTWKQLLFTYVIPLVPLLFAWDGAVSNARTYTLEDLDQLTAGLTTDEYSWQKGKISGRGSALYLIGAPTSHCQAN